jgi:hypothetical protein
LKSDSTIHGHRIGGKSKRDSVEDDESSFRIYRIANKVSKRKSSEEMLSSEDLISDVIDALSIIFTKVENENIK